MSKLEGPELASKGKSEGRDGTGRRRYENVTSTVSFSCQDPRVRSRPPGARARAGAEEERCENVTSTISVLRQDLRGRS
jgi:hypothetical protein